MPVYAATIAGVTKQLQDGFRIAKPANGRGSLQCAVVSRDGTYRPAIGAEVLITEDGVRIFGGNIDRPSETIFAGHAHASHTTQISAVDFNALGDRRYATLVQNPASLHSWLTLVTPFIPGASLDGSQPTGPILPRIDYSNRRVRDILDELAILAAEATGNGWIWEVDYNKVVRMIEAGTLSAPFNVSAGDKRVVGDIKVDETATDLTNRVILHYGSGIKQVTKTFTGDGSTVVFPLTIPMAGFPAVYVNGAYVHTAVHGVDTLFKWTYRSSDNSVVMLTEAPTGTFHNPLTGGDTLEVIYQGQFPGTVYSPASVPGDPYEQVRHAPDVFDETVAQAIADLLVERDDASIKTVVLDTYTPGWKPGQAFTVTNTQRALSATSCLVIDVSTAHERRRARRTVTAVVGSMNPGSWRDVFKQWSGGGSSGTSIVSGVPIVTNGGKFPGNVFAGAGGNGTNNIYEESLQFCSHGTLGGPGTQYGQTSETDRCSVFADYLQGGSAIGSGLIFAIYASTQGRFRLGKYPTGGANDFVFSKASGSATLALGAPTSFGLAAFGHRIDAIYTTDLDVSNGVVERGRSVKMGEWTSVGYAAGNFTASGSMTWTVQSGDHGVLKYSLVGKTLTVQWYIFDSSVGGTLSTSLRIAIPGGFVSASQVGGVHQYINNGVHGVGSCFVASGGTTINLFLLDYTTSWSASANDTDSVGTFSFEIL